MHEAPLYVRRVFAAGASGYVTKSEMTEMLLTAIRSIAIRRDLPGPGPNAVDLGDSPIRKLGQQP